MKFLSLRRLFMTMRGTPQEARLESLLRLAGCGFHEMGLLKSACVAIVGIGGLPVTREDPLEIGGMAATPESIAAAFGEMRGGLGFVTYLNPNDRTPEEMEAILVRNRHGSTAHACSVNVGIFGLSSAVEHEFDCQRDLVHLARVTVARTKAQDYPPLVVHDERTIDACRELRARVKRVTEDLRTAGIEGLETVNALWPKSSATAVVLSGTLRNLSKLAMQKTDVGKEHEYRRLLAMMGETLKPLATDLF